LLKTVGKIFQKLEIAMLLGLTDTYYDVLKFIKIGRKFLKTI